MIPLLFIGVLAYALTREGSMRHPAPKAADWVGWVWPVANVNGRAPEVTDGYSRTKTEAHRKHLGVDIMFRKRAGDPDGLPYSSANYTGRPGGEYSPIVAAGPGVIWSADLSPRGWQITIDHGKHVGGCTTYYQHLAGFSTSWAKGDHVNAGDLLGFMGGDISEGANPVHHLHFELLFPRAGTSRDSWTADPAPYMKFWTKGQVT